jgi:hypothetical protein
VLVGLVVLVISAVFGGLEPARRVAASTWIFFLWFLVLKVVTHFLVYSFVSGTFLAVIEGLLAPLEATWDV